MQYHDTTLTYRSKEDKPNTTPNPKRRRDEPITDIVKESQSAKSRKSPPPIDSATPPSTKKSVSLNEYKRRKNNANGSNEPLTPTLQKTLPSDQLDSPRQPSTDKLDSPSQSTTKPRDDPADAQKFTDKSQRYTSLLNSMANLDISPRAPN